MTKNIFKIVVVQSNISKPNTYFHGLQTLVFFTSSFCYWISFLITKQSRLTTALMMEGACAYSCMSTELKKNSWYRTLI